LRKNSRRPSESPSPRSSLRCPLDLRVFESFVLKKSLPFFKHRSGSLAPPSRLSPSSATFHACPRSTQEPCKRYLASVIVPYSIFKRSNPFFHLTFARRLESISGFQEVPPSGFGYPLGEISPTVQGSFFQLPTLMGFTLRSFAPEGRSKDSFQSFIRSCTFMRNLLGLALVLQRLIPDVPAVPLYDPEGLVPGGTLTSMGLLAFQAFSFLDRSEGHLHLQIPLSMLG
jgi:hypothetical protein